jgi:hypothetical protein
MMVPSVTLTYRQAFREIEKHWRTMAAQAERLGW